MLLDDWSYFINVSSGRKSKEVKCVMGQKIIIKYLSCNTTYMSRHCPPTHTNFSFAEKTPFPSVNGSSGGSS